MALSPRDRQQYMLMSALVLGVPALLFFAGLVLSFARGPLDECGEVACTSAWGHLPGLVVDALPVIGLVWLAGMVALAVLQRRRRRRRA
jgi:hypothetical protein